MRLQDMAAQLNVELRGDGQVDISHVNTLQEAGQGALSFLSNSRYRKFLSSTQASAVIVERRYADLVKNNVLIAENPYLVFARASRLLNPDAEIKAGIHSSAIIDDTAEIDASAFIGPAVVIGSNSVIGAGVSIAAACVIGANCRIGPESCLKARVTLCDDTVLGDRCIIHPGAVIGSDGFGLANDNGHWVKIPQVGRVVIGNDVEVGANTTIDRGSLNETVIEEGVKLDNLIQVGHNVHIGKHTAAAAFTGISGSTRIGDYCLLAGGVGFAGHLKTADHVQVTGMTLVTRSLDEAGVYSGNLPASSNRQWRKNVVNFRRLDKLNLNP
ncbi:MAG: UDP-3-O-(3-hydroxymyristoyl)glucosamine N-acyltransferase [gamma proteobacterium symbiont of Bathyaustriella thionipta]|nr:UDP-3-O-(3-hydroxymyristoyl)glucosamine N-acyltransferase [gamma proteobacterium symbiont of Bathyaustriella thionipta]